MTFRMTLWVRLGFFSLRFSHACSRTPIVRVPAQYHTPQKVAAMSLAVKYNKLVSVASEVDSGGMREGVGVEGGG